MNIDGSHTLQQKLLVDSKLLRPGYSWSERMGKEDPIAANRAFQVSAALESFHEKAVPAPKARKSKSGNSSRENSSIASAATQADDLSLADPSSSESEEV